ncbi:MAG: undecaprenyldiphospho-muramoylpentapeptide beta-N-acetylglucosaminyltransferase [Legionellales bacterium]|jgi:UDP-N-acetylglucosamine--N-acetylmuramyl-(pentapeptide) pyrophosphoryl-undecaprenol N-acetylglucosamine transferase
MTKSILIAAGGTGGHVFPGLALAHAFQARGYTVTWIGTKKGIEAKVIPNANIPIDFLQVVGLRGKDLKSLLLAPFRLTRALYQTYKIFKKRKPDLVLGLGGFVSGPAGIIAFLTGTPYVLHEQNAVAGLTNRYLAHIAKRIFSSFPDAFKSTKNIIVTGNPVREQILALQDPQTRFAQHTGPLRILVLGGSLGAMRLNEVLPEAIAKLNMPVIVKHQNGEHHFEKTLQAYQAIAPEHEVLKFIDNMADAYAWADLIVCRAGATTIAELMVVGLGAIFIPYPSAVDDHQTKNGLYLVKANAARMILQKDLTPDLLATTLQELGQRERCLQMAIAAKDIYAGDAVGQIINSCEELLNGQ